MILDSGEECVCGSVCVWGVGEGWRVCATRGYVKFSRWVEV